MFYLMLLLWFLGYLLTGVILGLGFAYCGGRVGGELDSEDALETGVAFIVLLWPFILFVLLPYFVLMEGAKQLYRYGKKKHGR